MTPELAAEKAADMLDLATDDVLHGDIVENRIAIADAWMRLHTALAHAPKPTEPATPDEHYEFGIDRIMRRNEELKRAAGLANAPKTTDPVSPASAEALKHQLDEQQGQLAWLHSGYLNLGYWHDRAVCGGCMATIEHAEDVEAHYRLVPIEGLTIRDADGDDDVITDQGVIDVDPAPLISYFEGRRHR